MKKKMICMVLGMIVAGAMVGCGSSGKADGNEAVSRHRLMQRMGPAVETILPSSGRIWKMRLRYCQNMLKSGKPKPVKKWK